MRARRSSSWWRETVTRLAKSGLTREEFAAREDLSVDTLKWWVAAFRRPALLKKRGAAPCTAIVPLAIEIAPTRATSSGAVEISVRGVVVRVEVGTDVEYVATLVRRFEDR